MKETKLKKDIFRTMKIFVPIFYGLDAIDVEELAYTIKDLIERWRILK